MKAVFVLAVCSLYSSTDEQQMYSSQQVCAAKLQALAGALNKFAPLNSGKYPYGNDASGWEELRRLNLISGNDDYICPQSGIAFNYIGGKSTTSNPEAPIAWCATHHKGDKLSNVLLVSGKIIAMASPMTYIPAMKVSSDTFPNATTPQAPAVRANNDVFPSAPEPAVVSKTPVHWVKGPDANWFVHYDDALAAARRENKKILLLHTGSDWCGWCKRLVRDVLEKEEFKRFARNNLILLYFDSPSRRHPMSADQREHVKQVESKLNVSGGYPGTFIFDTNGQRVGKISGYRKLEGYLSELKKLVGDRSESYETAATVTSAVTTAKTPGWITVSTSKDSSHNAPLRSRIQERNQPDKTVAPAHWLKGPTNDWYIHLEDAKAAAKRTGRKIYALHTGSDWCPPCMNLEKTILSTAEFKQFAQENIILLFVDSPRRKPIPDDQRAYNRQLARQLRFGNGVPSILLLDSDGKPITRIGGRRDVNTHISAIKDAIK